MDRFPDGDLARVRLDWLERIHQLAVCHHRNGRSQYDRKVMALCALAIGGTYLELYVLYQVGHLHSVPLRGL
jgi:hypothetical protein